MTRDEALDEAFRLLGESCLATSMLERQLAAATAKVTELEAELAAQQAATESALMGQGHA